MNPINNPSCKPCSCYKCLLSLGHRPTRFWWRRRPEVAVECVWLDVGDASRIPAQHGHGVVLRHRCRQECGHQLLACEQRRRRHHRQRVHWSQHQVLGTNLCIGKSHKANNKTREWFKNIITYCVIWSYISANTTPYFQYVMTSFWKISFRNINHHSGYHLVNSVIFLWRHPRNWHQGREQYSQSNCPSSHSLTPYYHSLPLFTTSSVAQK